MGRPVQLVVDQGPQVLVVVNLFDGFALDDDGVEKRSGSPEVNNQLFGKT